jgi:hypothetical protein
MMCASDHASGAFYLQMLKEFPPPSSRPACPLCQPELFDASLSETPSLLICAAHINEPAAQIFLERDLDRQIEEQRREIERRLAEQRQQPTPALGRELKDRIAQRLTAEQHDAFPGGRWAT